ncbi:hypothetical protein HK104_005660 [Borealophlyctis nickersoniae]|nr:hypothetical protein HK104_005660 [Borealophlyctis nickersoniae]
MSDTNPPIQASEVDSTVGPPNSNPPEIENTDLAPVPSSDPSPLDAVNPEYRSDSSPSVTTETSQAPDKPPPVVSTEEVEVGKKFLEHGGVEPPLAGGLGVDEDGGIQPTGGKMSGEVVDEGKHVVVYGVEEVGGYVGGNQAAGATDEVGALDEAGMQSEQAVGHATDRDNTGGPEEVDSGLSGGGQKIEEKDVQKVVENGPLKSESADDEYADLRMDASELPVTNVDIKADPDALEYLTSLDRLFPDLYFTDRLPIHTGDPAAPSGTHILAVSEGLFQSTPCYVVTSSTEAQIPQTSETITTNLKAHIGSKLETFAQSLHHVVRAAGGGPNEEAREEEFVQEMFRSGDGSLIITESGSRAPLFSVRFASDVVAGIIMEGAQCVLTRLLARQSTARTLAFLTYFNHSLVKTRFSVAPGEIRNIGGSIKNVVSIAASMERAEVPDASAEMSAAQGNASSISSLADEKESGENDDEGLDWMGQFLADGRSVYMKPPGSTMIMELDQVLPSGVRDAVEDMPANPYDTHDFGGNIELQSEYQDRKNEITQAHEKYIAEHPELRELCVDYLQLILHRKPQDVFAFTAEYFTM